MQIYSQLAPLALGGAHGSAVAMGFFDGIHIGHRAVINGAVEWAKAHGAAPAVFTFRLPTENKMKGKRLRDVYKRQGGERVREPASAGGRAKGGAAPVQRLPHQPLPGGRRPLPCCLLYTSRCV